MNYAPTVPWYRRFAFGDPYPNTFSWKVFEAEMRGAWVLVERHTRECTCSYCRGEHGHGFLWLPSDRKRGWRVLNFWHRLYVRWVPHSRHAEPRYSKEANYQVPPSGQ
jgi:hypothetical protein